MKEYRASDIRARAERFGPRTPDIDIKLMFLLSPVLGDTEGGGHARRRAARGPRPTGTPSRQLALLSSRDEGARTSLLDLRPGRPVPRALTQRTQSTLRTSSAMDREDSPEAASKWEIDSSRRFGRRIRWPERMGESWRRWAVTAYLISNHGETLHRRYIGEGSPRGLVPALQRLGLTRTSYEYDTFREETCSPFVVHPRGRTWGPDYVGICEVGPPLTFDQAES